MDLATADIAREAASYDAIYTLSCGKGYNPNTRTWADNYLSRLYKGDKPVTYRSAKLLPPGVNVMLVFMTLASHNHIIGKVGKCFLSFVLRRENKKPRPLQYEDEWYKEEWGWNKIYWEKGYVAYTIEDKVVHKKWIDMSYSGCPMNTKPKYLLGALAERRGAQTCRLRKIVIHTHTHSHTQAHTHTHCGKKNPKAPNTTQNTCQ